MRIDKKLKKQLILNSRNVNLWELHEEHLPAVSTIEREAIIEEMNQMKSSYDVYIKLFGDLEIITPGDRLTEQIINGPKMTQTIW